MGADATAANYLATRQAAADPMRAFAAGVEVRSNLQKIDLAAQMGQIDTLLNMAKLQTEQAENRSREKLATQQLEIAKFNADTNRINALRPRTTKSSSGGGMGGGGMIFHDDGSVTVGGAADPTGGQYPTTGEGDGIEQSGQGDGGQVQPLQAGASQSVSLFPQGGSMQDTTAAPLSGMGKQASAAPSAGASFGMDGHSAGGDLKDTPAQPAPQQQVQFPGPGETTESQKKYKGNFVISSMNPKTGSMTLKSTRELNSEEAENAPVIPADPNVLQKINAIYEGFGQVAVPTNDKSYRHGYKFIDKPDLHGKGISDLSADEQKRLGDLSSELMNLTLNNKLATPEAKMAAMGVTNPKEMTEEMWQEGWNRVQNDPNTPVDPAANASIMRKATELAGFKNLMFGTTVNTPQGILEQMGIDTKGMFKQESTGEQWAGDGAKGKLPAVVATAAAATGAPKAATAATSAPTAPAQAASDDPIVNEARRTEEIRTRNREATLSKKGPSAEENQKWEDSKFKLLKALNDTSTSAEEVNFLLPVGGSLLSKGGVSAGMTKWFDANKDKLDFKPLDGKPLTLESPVFATKDGRQVKLKEVYQAMLKDPRIVGAKASEGTTKSGNAMSVTVGKTREVQ